MSTTAKKSAVKGIRYTPAQKKEVVDFALSYNAANGRGGQSKAAEKFNISQITVAAWLKAAGAGKAPKQAKAPKAAKQPKEKGGSRVGTRYTPEQKQEVVDFVNSYNAENGRGGQSKASEKFGVSPLTVMAWLKGAGSPKAGKKVVAKKGAKKAGRPAKAAAPAASGSGDISGKLNSLLSLSAQIDKAEAELAALRSKFSELKASL